MDFGNTFFFRGVDVAFGWSETYYVNALDHAAAKGLGTVLRTFRANILCANFQLVYLRTSQEGVPGDSLVDSTTVTGAIVTDPVDPWSALLIREEAGPTHRGRKFLHGVPESAFLADNQYDTGNADAAAFTAFLNAIKGSDYRLKIKGPLFVPITSAIAERMASHRVGRPFGLLRGRS